MINEEDRVVRAEMFFLKLLCAVIFPPLIPFIRSRFSWLFLFIMIAACCAGWVPGIIFGVIDVLSEKDDENYAKEENDVAASTETQLVPQQSTDAEQNKVEDRLSKLKQMLEQGIITEEEYTKKRSKIIDDL